MYLNAPQSHSPISSMTAMNPTMSGMSPMGGGPMQMMAMQQQLLSMMMGMLSSLFQGGFGGGEMSNSGGLPFSPSFGGASNGAIPGSGGLNDFLGGSSAPQGLFGSQGAQNVRGPKGPKGNSGGAYQAPSQPGGKSKFNVASFNVLGSSHTSAGGNKADKASGVARMRGAVASMKKHNVDIAGMQEFQGDQQAAFKRLAPDFGVVGEKDNAIVYNKKKFRLVEKKSFTIPYFEGNKREMPIAKLEDRATGKQMWVVNIHNPADTKAHPNNAKNRAKAISIEQDLMRKLQATGLPVIFTGDFNARNGVDQSMDRAGMDSAAPNKARSEIDYIYGSSGVNFSNYVADHRPQSNGTSDHPIIVSSATI